MTTGFINYVIMEFLSLSNRPPPSGNVLSGEGRGETAVFVGYIKASYKTR